MAISKKSWLGVAREATPGTAIASPTLYAPCKSMIKAMKKREYLDEERGDRNEHYDVVDSIRWTDWDEKGPFYPDTGVYFLLAAMGSVSSAQPNAGSAPTVWKHTLNLADVPAALTLFKSFDAKTYYTPYSCVEKVKIKFDSKGKLLELDTSGKAIWPTKMSSPPTPSFSTVKPFAGYAPIITLASGQTADIDELEIDFEQKITLWNPSNGQQDWVTAYYGGRKVSVSFTARFDSDALYENYYRNPQNDTLTVDVQGANIASTYNYEMNIQVPVLSYDSMEHDLGKDNVLIKAKATGLATGAGAGNNLLKLWVQNTISNSYTV